MRINELTTGTITKKLAVLALPIMGTSFLQMAYNLIDMIWIGRLGSDAVAAIGTAGFFMWFSFSLITLSRVGVEVKVAQALGGQKEEEANAYAGTSLVFALAIGLLYGIVLLSLGKPLVSFFRLGDAYVESMAKSYLAIVAFSMPFTLLNQVISAVYNASGVSRLPFRVNAVGLLLNMVLDPLFIFYLDMGVAGAALATTLAQVFVTLLLIRMTYSDAKPYKHFRIRIHLERAKLKEMLHLSVPVALQNGLFTIISMFVARIVASFGTTAIAVQKVGTQIEAISYMTATGFGVALSAMVGQNLGAGKLERVKDSFKSAITAMSLYGLIVSILMYLFAEPIFSIFIKEEAALSMGVVYLRIISFSQLFMCVEITMSGGFNGLGKSVPPAVVGVGFNLLRIPLAYALSIYTTLGLNGIWWAINISTFFKGSVLFVILVLVLRKISSRSIIL